MKSRFRASSLIVALCLLSVTVLVAQTQQNYLLRSDGRVQVNGVLVPSTAVVSPGDVIETAKGSMARIASPGMSMLVGQSSRVVVKRGTLALDKGSASITSSTGAAIGAAQYSIAPSGTTTAKYQIANSGESLSVLSSGGPLAVSSSNGVTKIPSGQVGVISSNVLAVNSASTVWVDSSSVSFDQLSAPDSSPVCKKKTIRECICKTAKQCPLLR